MAFPWRIIKEAPATGSYLVEDMLMGIQMAKAGHPPSFCPEARVTSVLPDRDRAAMGQRRRWEHGSLYTALKQCPRLIALGVIELRLDLIAIGLDLAVPPLALLVMLIGTLFGIEVIACLIGADIRFLAGPIFALGLVACSVLGAWFKFARGELPFRALLAVPLYVLWKVPLYVSFLLKKRQKSWERTERT
jgi:hypothetical protein